MNSSKTVSAGKVLKDEFMEPFGLSAYRVAQEIHVPVSRIQDILHDRRKITADTSLRLGRFFGVSAQYFLDIQNAADMKEIDHENRTEIDMIRPLDLEETQKKRILAYAKEFSKQMME